MPCLYDCTKAKWIFECYLVLILTCIGNCTLTMTYDTINSYSHVEYIKGYCIKTDRKNRFLNKLRFPIRRPSLIYSKYMKMKTIESILHHLLFSEKAFCIGIDAKCHAWTEVVPLKVNQLLGILMRQWYVTCLKRPYVRENLTVLFYPATWRFTENRRKPLWAWTKKILKDQRYMWLNLDAAFLKTPITTFCVPVWIDLNFFKTFGSNLELSSPF